MDQSPFYGRITSRQNPRIKEAVRLRSSRERQRHSRFIIDGAREIARALAAGITPIEAFICDELCKSTDSHEAVAAIESTGAEVLRVSTDVFEKLAFGDRNDGVLIVAQWRQQNLADLNLPTNPIVAVLEGL